ENCHYTISVKTGSRHDSGTDAVIGIVLADKSGKYNEIKNLVSWGGNMEPGRDYFENDYLDIFTGTEQCPPTTICFMTLNSDGSATSPVVEQWLANSEPPYLLYAERDNCPSGIKKSPYSIQTCTYTINVQTGTRADSGTDAVIGIVLADQSEEYIEIKDLVNWGGKMPEGHDYFENGNLDIFSGTERCLPGPVCFMRLNSDNSGYKPGWYVVYVDVTTSKPGSVSKHQRFTVEQWLAVDEPPNQLYAERSNCPV
uniref:PLAT domain-containing protein n=2 Tax=Brassica oleracea TaxID=3712 RepID=A0A0D3DVW8_BRAOL